ncbi:sensor histidine kinase [Flagellimonas amphidinii]|uniref:sensor histidine kinase n=1 Tax=Flagellimonas amphidinii TaxID=2735167 RepID=UPI0028BDD73B|nr:ATP-binding protein [Allomuricauda amphidinii]
MIRYINSTNRKIAYFFDAIKNEDFTLRFPEKVTIESFKELNISLNRVNKLIQEVHLQLQIRERYYQEILKQANIGILTYNERGHILFSNPTVEKLLNHKPLNHIKQLQQVNMQLYRLFSELKPFDRKLFQLTNEREKTQLAIKSKSIALNDQAMLLVVVQDIHKELDEKETDSWVKLIRVLTHEIMNTITPITSISDSILKYFVGTDGQIIEDHLNKEQVTITAKGLEVIKEQGSNLMDFVKSYRTFLNVPEPDKTIVSAEKLLEKVKLLLPKVETSNSPKIEIHIEPKGLELFIDEKQITQVLVNLGKNALQSIGNQEQGKIVLAAGINSENKKYITVNDNGPGIPEDLINEIFVPFFTTKNSGTGIGLSLSKQILQLHGGSLNVQSLPHKKTVFTLQF